jgi:ACS family tartrate transporter-like MFS transporter
MIALTLAAIGQTFCINGLSAFLPQIVKGYGLTNQQVGLLLILPGFCTVLAVVLWTLHSDRTGERRWHAILPSLLGAASLVGAATLTSPSLEFAGLGIGVICTWCAATVLFVLPTTFLTGSAAAVGLACITAVGNIGGFAGPYVIGWLKDASGQFNAGIYACAACFVASATLTFFGTLRVDAAPRDARR